MRLYFLNDGSGSTENSRSLAALRDDNFVVGAVMTICCGCSGDYLFVAAMELGSREFEFEA
jgi:hypothetical protein